MTKETTVRHIKVKVGRWKYQCTACEEIINYMQRYNFCPFCGRRIVGGLRKKDDKRDLLPREKEPDSGDKEPW